jgi:hypothetical protein
MEVILIINVVLTKESLYLKGKEMGICMLPFTGTAEGPYFKGQILGEGIDTQRIYPDGRMNLSARYMLEGTDYKGNSCRIFIENEGEALDSCIPQIVTDSEDLQFLSDSKLTSVVTPTEQGVEVKIYRN